MVWANFKKLRLLRKFNGHTQEEFARLLGISQSAYARLESGYTRSWEIHLKDIAKLLNVSPDYFFTKDGKRKRLKIIKSILKTLGTIQYKNAFPLLKKMIAKNSYRDIFLSIDSTLSLISNQKSPNGGLLVKKNYWKNVNL